MLSAVIAAQLTPDVDVLAVNADPVTRGLADADVLELATAQGRTVVTDNVKDFARLNAQWAALGKAHPGLLFISAKAFPQDRARIGRIVAALRGRARTDSWPAPGQYDFL